MTDRKHKQNKAHGFLEDGAPHADPAELGREGRVEELKREVNELCRRLGEAARYPSQEEGSFEGRVARGEGRG